MPQIPPQGGLNASYTSAQIRRNRLIFLGLVLVIAGMVTFWALGPYDTKDQSATLKAGDCFQNIGTDKEAKTKKLDCTDPHADYKVLKMDKNGVVDTFSCSGVPGTTGSLTQTGPGKWFVVCFKKNDEKGKKQTGAA
ncbi:LppU/SCO3897 family protein [Streptomyces sp. NPDC002586]|uniref:LppU/SCO3897 family protein n=1 Tax=Streptomyces sp. NPDC002589 TaxID=3154420 RepID=UPI003327D273